MLMMNKHKYVLGCTNTPGKPKHFQNFGNATKQKCIFELCRELYLISTYVQFITVCVYNTKMKKIILKKLFLEKVYILQMKMGL